MHGVGVGVSVGVGLGVGLGVGQDPMHGVGVGGVAPVSTVTESGADVPPGPVQVILYVFVAFVRLAVG